MNVREFRERLAEYPDDMAVAIIDHNHDELDRWFSVDMAIDHPSTRHNYASWHWQSDHAPDRPEGRPTLVIY